MATIMASTSTPRDDSLREGSLRRRKTVKLTVLSLSDIQVRLPPPEPIEQIIVGEGGEYFASKPKRPTSSSEADADTSTNDAQCANSIIAPSLPQHLQPLLDKVGLGLDANSPRNRQKQQQQNERGNLSLSAAVSFSGSCPPEHMHVLSPSLCSRTGRMVVESDPILRHGEDVADRSVHSVKHSRDGTIAHFLVAKWDGADAALVGKTEQLDKSVDGVSADSSKSENWRRRRAASFRRMGTSSSMSSQPHMTASLQHRPDDGATTLYNPSCNTSSPSDDSTPARVRSDIGGKTLYNLEEEEHLKTSGTCSDINVAHQSSDEIDPKGSTRLPCLDETDESSSRKSSKSSAGTHPFPRVLRGVSPPPPDARKRRGMILPRAANTKPAPPVAADLPDIIELNIDLLVGRDVASRVDGDNGGMLQLLDPQDPIGGVAHIVLKADDLATDGIHTFNLPVRRRSPTLGTAPHDLNKNVLDADSTHPVVELGDGALLRVRIEIVSPSVQESDFDDDEKAIQWTLSGVSAAVAAGKEEADGEDVSIAKTFADDDQVNTASDILATDVANRGTDERIPRTGMFCAALPGVLDMWGALTKKCIVNCVDHCDDDALVYVNDGDGGDSIGSTIDTVYSKIMY